MTTTTEVIDTLRSAQMLLRRDGWRQHSYGPITSHIARQPRCVGGALTAATEFRAIAAEARRVLQETICEGTRPVFDELERWNDRPGRTEDDVIDLLDKTIARLEASQ